MNGYVAESLTTDAGRFGHVGFCQLRSKHWLQFMRAYCDLSSCPSLASVNVILMPLGVHKYMYVVVYVDNDIALYAHNNYKGINITD